MILRVCCIIIIFTLLFACHKSDKPCQYCNSKCSHQPGNIIGKWNLIALGSYSAPGNQGPVWISPNPNKPVIIEFKNDSMFEYNANYAWAAADYNRYKMMDSVNFKIYSADSIFSRPLSGEMLNANEIQLTYMGVDQGTMEKYACAEPQ